MRWPEQNESGGCDLLLGWYYKRQAGKLASQQRQKELRERGIFVRESLRSNLDWLNSMCLGGNAGTDRGSQRLFGCFDLGNLGTINVSSEPITQAASGQRLLNVGITTGENHYDLRRNRSRVTEGLPKTSQETRHHLISHRRVYDEGGVRELEEIAKRVSLLTNAAASVVSAINILEQELDNRGRIIGKRFCFPAVFEEKVNNIPTRISYGWVETPAPEDQPHHMIRVIQTEEIALVIGERGGIKRTGLTHPAALAKYRLKGREYNPADAAAATLLRLTEQDISFLNEAVKILPFAQITRWRTKNNTDPTALYGQWQTVTEILGRQEKPDSP